MILLPTRNKNSWHGMMYVKGISPVTSIILLNNTRYTVNLIKDTVFVKKVFNINMCFHFLYKLRLKHFSF
jgi:hypothetical protein